jgi:hypothetical protein
VSHVVWSQAVLNAHDSSGALIAGVTPRVKTVNCNSADTAAGSYAATASVCDGAGGLWDGETFSNDNNDCATTACAHVLPSSDGSEAGIEKYTLSLRHVNNEMFANGDETPTCTVFFTPASGSSGSYEFGEPEPMFVIKPVTVTANSASPSCRSDPPAEYCYFSGYTDVTNQADHVGFCPTFKELPAADTPQACIELARADPECYQFAESYSVTYGSGTRARRCLCDTIPECALEAHIEFDRYTCAFSQVGTSCQNDPTGALQRVGLSCDGPDFHSWTVTLGIEAPSCALWIEDGPHKIAGKLSHASVSRAWLTHRPCPL